MKGDTCISARVVLVCSGVAELDDINSKIPSLLFEMLKICLRQKLSNAVVFERFIVKRKKEIHKSVSDLSSIQKDFHLKYSEEWSRIFKQGGTVHNSYLCEIEDASDVKTKSLPEVPISSILVEV
jgi:hypothetical protein